MSGCGVNKTLSACRRIETDERVVRSERIVEGATVAEPHVGRTASRHRRLREVIHRIGWMRFSVIRDDWRSVVEVAEIQSATAILLDIEPIGFLADANPRGVADRP